MAEKSRDTVNRRALFMAVIPLAISVTLLAGVYYHFYLSRSSQQTITIATGVPGSAISELLEAIADRLALENPDYMVRHIATSGTEANIKLLEKGEIDIAAIPSDAITRPNFAQIASLYPDTYHIIVHADSGIDTIHDLAGKKIAVPPQTSSAYRSFWYLIGQYGINPEVVKAHPMTQAESFNAMRHKLVDAAFYMEPPANKRTRWLAEAARIKILNIDQAGAMAMRNNALIPVKIPKGVFGGMPPIPAADMMSVAANRILITRNDFPDEMIRAVTSVLFDHRRELSLNSHLAGFISQPDARSSNILAIHPGAQAFFDRDQPSFLQVNAEVIGVLFSIFAVLVSVGLWAKRMWTERQKGRIDVYNLDLVKIVENARSSTTPEQLEQHKKILLDMLSRVVRDLDEDKIDGEGFHFFAFTWEAAYAVIRGRERDLGCETEASQHHVELLKQHKK